MKTQLIRSLTALVFCASLYQAVAQGTAFTYQGQLQNNGSPANGLYDFTFSLSNAPSGGTQVGPTINNPAVGVTNGLFTTTLNFGSVFTGNPTWLAISVRTNGVGNYASLTPLQPLTPTPYAIFAASASNVSGTISAAQLSGSVSNSQLVNSSITVTAGAGLTGGGTVPLGGSIALSATGSGLASVTGNSDITATTAGGAVTLGDTATNANIAGTIVKRDTSGSFTNTSITLSGNLNLPITTTSAGIIYSGTNTLILAPAGISSEGPGSFFAGPGAGLLTSPGTLDNTGVGAQALSLAYAGGNSAFGYQALQVNGYGNNNSAFGFQALSSNTTGNGNTAIGSETLWYQGAGSSGVGNYNSALGYQALYHNLSGSANTASGYQSLWENGAGINNTASGYQTLGDNTSGSANTIDGAYAAFFSTTGSTNTAAGYQSLYHNTIGSFNVADGGNALFSNTTGSNNIALGYGAGYNLTTGNLNIDIGNPGVATDTNIIRIGNSQSQAFIAGALTGNGGGLTNVNASQVGGLNVSNLWQTTGNAGISPGVNFVGTTDGSELVFKANNLEGLRLTTSQSLILQRPSEYADFSERNGLGVYGFTSDFDTGYRTFANQNVLGPVLYGEGGGGLGIISSTSQQILALSWSTSGVIVNLPTTVTASIAATGFTTFGAPAGDFFAGLNSGNSTMTGQNNTAIGYNTLSNNTTGNYNLAAGGQALYNNTTGNYNTAVGDDAMKLNITGAAELAVGYQALEDGTNLNYSTAVGYQSLRSSTTEVVNNYDGIGDDETNGDYNTALGYQSMLDTTTGQGNTAVGYQALDNNTVGEGNIAVGLQALGDNTSGGQNIAIGWQALGNTTTGAGNIAVGWQAGQTVTTGINNIDIGNVGIAGDNNVIRIGTSGTQTTTYIAGTIQNPTCTALTCASITITGGSDLAEPFSISTKDQPVAEGSVVVIDEANPGQLQLTDRPYDTRVAGVVSGANGIHPGIQMHQQGLLEGGKNVALSGRVYVQADTSNGAIRPGDMLTTSSTPGRAMKVSDHLRAQGAILGKAMTALKEGQGMVLVLVTLQ